MNLLAMLVRCGDQNSPPPAALSLDNPTERDKENRIMTEARIALVEDDAAYRRDLVALLKAHPGWRVVADCGDMDEARHKIPAARPNLVLLDIRLAGADGIRLIPELKARLPKLSIVLLTVVEDTARIIRSFEAGAEGYLLKKEKDYLITGVEDAWAGRAAMSPGVAIRVRNWFRLRAQSVSAARSALEDREWEILKLIAGGATQQEAADQIGIKLHDVKNACKRIYVKLGVTSSREAIAKVGGRNPLDNL